MVSDIQLSSNSRIVDSLCFGFTNSYSVKCQNDLLSKFSKSKLYETPCL